MVEGTQGELRQIEETLLGLDQKMRSLCAELPAPVFEEGTDRPLNTSAEIYALLSSTVEDEIRSALETLRRAKSLTEGAEPTEVPVDALSQRTCSRSAQ